MWHSKFLRILASIICLDVAGSRTNMPWGIFRSMWWNVYIGCDTYFWTACYTVLHYFPVVSVRTSVTFGLPSQGSYMSTLGTDVCYLFTIHCRLHRGFKDDWASWVPRQARAGAQVFAVATQGRDQTKPLRGAVKKICKRGDFVPWGGRGGHCQSHYLSEIFQPILKVKNNT